MKETCLASKAGNTKIGEGVWSYSKLYGSKFYLLRTLQKMVQGSCCGHCEGCENACYVARSYRYPSVIERHAMNTYLMRVNLHKAFENIRNQLAFARIKPVLYRIDQSGEIESYKEFVEWCDTAKANPTTVFYVYTKNYDVIEKAFENGIVPSNLIVLVSIWHEYGIETYLKLAKYKNVKAFVYVDGFNYESYGIHIETFCMAYDINGKMNHAITCIKCGKCWKGHFKVIGCYDHSGKKEKGGKK